MRHQVTEEAQGIPLLMVHTELVIAKKHFQMVTTQPATSSF